MKLSNIRDDVDLRPAQVRLICGRPTLLSEAVKRVNSPPLSYLFIESVIDAKILDEAEQGRLGALLQAGMAKLNAALTPGSSSDLDALLTFQAPQGGGSKAIASLVQQAKSAKGDVTQNKDWWNSLFNVFGVTDDSIKKNIVSQVQQDMGTETTVQSEPEKPETQPEAQNQKPAQTQTTQGQPTQGSKPQDALSSLKSERDTEQSYQDDIAGQLAGIRKQREANRAEIGHLRDRLEKLRGQPQSTESICRPIALNLLQEYTVRRHLNAVASHMLHRLAHRANLYVRVPLIERSLGERLRGALGDFATNPRRTKEKLAGFTGSANNERAAKLAVQALTDHARSAFEAKLAENNMTPDQIVKNLKTWQDLKALYEKNPTPKVVDAYMAASQNLKKVGELFGSAAQFDVEQPVEAEVVEQPKTWDDVDPRSPFKPEQGGSAENPLTWDDVDPNSPFKPQAEEPAPTWDDVDPNSPFKPQAEEPAVDPRSPFAQQESPEEKAKKEAEAASFRQSVADLEKAKAGERPLLNKREQAVAKAASLALGIPTEELENQIRQDDKIVIEMMASDQGWSKLMANSPVMRGAVEKALRPYADRGINTENLPRNARSAVLRAIFKGVKE